MFLKKSWKLGEVKETTRWCKIFKTLITYLHTYSMVQRPSWDANWFAASQEIPRILWNPKVHYCTQKRPPAVPILGQPNQSTNPHPTSWRTILILSTHLRLGLPSGLFLSGFPTKILWVHLFKNISKIFTCVWLHKMILWNSLISSYVN